MLYEEWNKKNKTQTFYEISALEWHIIHNNLSHYYHHNENIHLEKEKKKMNKNYNKGEKEKKKWIENYNKGEAAAQVELEIPKD